MSEQKNEIDYIDDMNLYLRQSETLTSTLMCANLHDPSARELNGIFSLLNDQIRRVQKSFAQYVDSQGVDNEKAPT